jgi:hypothetical protein
LKAETLYQSTCDFKANDIACMQQFSRLALRRSVRQLITGFTGDFEFVSLRLLGFEFQPKPRQRTERPLYLGLILSIAANRLWGNGLSATRETRLPFRARAA